MSHTIGAGPYGGKSDLFHIFFPFYTQNHLLWASWHLLLDAGTTAWWLHPLQPPGWEGPLQTFGVKAQKSELDETSPGEYIQRTCSVVLFQQQNVAGGWGAVGTATCSGHIFLGLLQQRRAAKVLWSKGRKMTDNTEPVQRNRWNN